MHACRTSSDVQYQDLAGVEATPEDVGRKLRSRAIKSALLLCLVSSLVIHKISRARDEQ